MVPALSVIFIIINLLLGIAIPVGLCIFFRKKYHASFDDYDSNVSSSSNDWGI